MMFRWLFPVGVLLLAQLVGCQGESRDPQADEDTAPTVLHGELQISATAQESLDLKTVEVRQSETQETMLATGWLALPPAGEVIVKAPATGFVSLKEGGTPWLGRAVSAEEPLADLHVFLSPQEQAQFVMAKEEADTLIKQSLASLNLAEEQLRQLDQDAGNVVAGKQLLELREIVARSRAAEQEAREKLPFLPKEPYGDEVRLKDVPLHAPLAGRVVDLHIAPGQLVVQGDPLWTIADWSRLWIRVPIYGGDVPRVLSDQPVDVSVPGGESPWKGQPLPVPQATEPQKQTLSLLYAIDNAKSQLRPGQAVSVSLPTGEKALKIVIPPSAILWDGVGNSWVYLRTSPAAFRRQKVELGQQVAEEVIVERGLKVGDTVVVTGAEALYGEEFRSQIQGDDD